MESKPRELIVSWLTLMLLIKIMCRQYGESIGHRILQTSVDTSNNKIFKLLKPQHTLHYILLKILLTTHKWQK